jgi:hypothetical protein
VVTTEEALLEVLVVALEAEALAEVVLAEASVVEALAEVVLLVVGKFTP